MLSQILGKEPATIPSLVALGAAAFTAAPGISTSGSARLKRFRAVALAVLAVQRLLSSVSNRRVGAARRPSPPGQLDWESAGVWPGGDAGRRGEEVDFPHPPLLRLLPFSAALLLRVDDAQLCEMMPAVSTENYALPAIYNNLLGEHWKEGLGELEYLPPPSVQPPYYRGSTQALRDFAVKGIIPGFLSEHPAALKALAKAGKEGALQPPFPSLVAFENAINLQLQTFAKVSFTG